MTAALISALICAVALLVVTAYSIMGSAPLLVLNHDTPLDARFIRNFFNTYYLAVMVTASATAISYALAERAVFAVGAAALVFLAVILRKTMTAKMDQLGTHIQVSGPEAIQSFRRAHLSALLINVAQLVLIVWSLTTLSLK